MVETRKLAAILVSDVVGYSRLAGADEDRILSRLRALRSDLIAIPGRIQIWKCVPSGINRAAARSSAVL